MHRLQDTGHVSLVLIFCTRSMIRGNGGHVMQSSFENALGQPVLHRCPYFVRDPGWGICSAGCVQISRYLSGTMPRQLLVCTAAQDYSRPRLAHSVSTGHYGNTWLGGRAISSNIFQWDIGAGCLHSVTTEDAVTNSVTEFGRHILRLGEHSAKTYQLPVPGAPL